MAGKDPGTWQMTMTTTTTLMCCIREYMFDLYICYSTGQIMTDYEPHTPKTHFSGYENETEELFL